MVARAEVDRARRASTPAARSARSAAVQRSSFRPRVRSASNSVRHLRRRPRSSTGRSPARSPPPSARRRARATPAPTTPSASPRQPACRTASARRARRCARPRSAGSRPTSRASARRARPSRARRPARRACPACARCTVGECTWRLNASALAGERRAPRTRCAGSPRRAPGRRRCRGVRFSDSYGALADAADSRRERDDVARLRPSGSREQLLRALEQLLARVAAPGRATTSSSSACSVRPICGPGPVAERDQIVAVDREVAQPVRARELAARPRARKRASRSSSCRATAARPCRAGRPPCGRADRTSARRRSARAVAARAAASPLPGRTCARARCAAPACASSFG